MSKAPSASPPKQLLGLGIVGKNNVPLYMCDCAALLVADPSAPSQAEDGDYYGFSSQTSSLQSQSLPVQQQLLMHAALDQVDDLVETIHGEGISSPFSGMPVRKKPTSKDASSHHHYLGILLDLGEWQVHGYITVTNLKIMALTQRGATAIRPFLEQVHRMWIAYTMNPFHPVRDLVTIESVTFDQNIQRAVQRYAGVSVTTTVE